MIAVVLHDPLRVVRLHVATVCVVGLILLCHIRLSAFTLYLFVIRLCNEHIIKYIVLKFLANQTCYAILFWDYEEVCHARSGW